jgi:ATP-dependent Clp protease protease subunit
VPTVGRKAPAGKEHTQSVVFWKDKGWTEASSRKWVEDHDYFTDGLDETDTQFRWRQYDPDETEFIYRNQEIEKDSISLVLGIPKKDAKNMKKNNSEPIRCFEGNTQPHEPFWTWLNAIEGEDPEMELYGYISEWSWFEDDITPKKFRDDLMKYGQGGPIKIRLNSYGGDVIAASMISSIMRDYPGKITVQIDGIAASAATMVAVSANAVQIQDNAYFMIHDPLAVFFMAALNIEDLTRMVSSLEAVKEGILNAYEVKTGLSRTRLSKLMTDETWMDAKKAQDLGFVDEILTNPNNEIRIPIENAAYVNGLRNYTKVPAALLQALTQGDQPAILASSGSMLTDEQKREAQILRDQIDNILRKGEK